MKKNVLRIVICILAVSALLCAFAIMASAEAKPIYIGRIGNDATIGGTKYARWASQIRLYLTKDAAGTETEGVFDKNAEFGIKNSGETLTNCVFIPLDGDVSAQKENLVESGLFYEFDASTGKMTITGKIKKQSDDKDVPWFIPAIDGVLTNVKSVVFAEDTGITRIPDHAFNNCSKIVSVEFPATVKLTENESFGRMGALKTVKVAGSELGEGTIDLRTLKSYDRQTFHTSLAYGTTIYISEALMDKENSSFGAKEKEGLYKVYAPRAEACKFATTIATGIAAGTKYTVEVYPTSDCSIKQLGYQVRIEGYTGLRSRFGVVDEEPFSLKVAEAGVVLEEPVKTPLDGGEEAEIIERGVIVSTKSTLDTIGCDLTKNGDVYETADKMIKKVVVDESNMNDDGYFYVTVVKYSTKAQMEQQIAMVPYEIKKTVSGVETVNYGSSLDASSIYDATIGLYTKGLINASVEKDNVFWDVLNNFKYKVEFTEEGQKLITDNSKTYAYSLSENDDLVILDVETGKAKYAPLSVFKLADGTYTAIAHLDPAIDSTTFGGAAFATSDWKIETNQLAPFFIGVTIKTIVVDDGITSISADAFKGFYNHADETGAGEPSLEYVIYADSAIGCGGFNKAKRLRTVLPFSKTRTMSEEDWAKYDGIYDLSGFTSWLGSSYIINQSKTVKGIIFPKKDGNKALAKEFLCDSGATFQYLVCDGNEPTLPDETTKAKTYDFRGTGYYIEFTEEGGSYSTTLNVFKGMWTNVIIIQDEPDGKTYKYTVTSTSGPYTCTREVYSAS